MSFAWQTSVDDVLNVAKRIGKDIDERQAENILLIDLDHSAIEHAALMGNDIDEQTEYAYQEIEKQIKNN